MFSNKGFIPAMFRNNIFKASLYCIFVQLFLDKYVARNSPNCTYLPSSGEQGEYITLCLMQYMQKTTINFKLL